MLKAAWKDPVWSKVIATAILAIIAAGWAYSQDLWPRIGGWFLSVWAAAGRPSQVPNWIVGGLVVCALPTVVLLVALLWQSIRPKGGEAAQSSLTWRSYTQDNFYGLLWRWRYSSGSNGVRDLTTFCPHCDYQVFPHDEAAYAVVPRIGFHCDSCGRELPTFNESFESLQSKVERFVHRKLRTESWKDAVLPNRGT